MKFNVVTTLKYTAKSAGTLILNIRALKDKHQNVISETLVIDPFVNAEEIVLPHDLGGQAASLFWMNRCLQLRS